MWWPPLEESELSLARRCALIRSEMAARPDWASLAVITHWGFIRGFTGMTVANGAVLRIDPLSAEAAPVPLLMPRSV